MRKRMSIAAVVGMTSMVLALPVGLAVSLILRRRSTMDQAQADQMGLWTVIILSCIAAGLGRLALWRLSRAQKGRLRGFHYGVLAWYGGMCILLACAIVTFNRLTMR